MSNTIYPKKFWGIPLQAVQLHAVGLKAVFFRDHALVKYLGQLSHGGVYSLGW